MFKKIYENELEKIQINQKLKDKLAQELFSQRKRKSNGFSALFFRFKKLTFVAAPTFGLIGIITFGSYLLLHSSFKGGSGSTESLSLDNFFGKAYAYYDNNQENVKNDLLKYSKYLRTTGKDRIAYDTYINQKLIESIAAHQPEKLQDAQKAFEEHTFFDPWKSGLDETWLDQNGSYLQLSTRKTAPLRSNDSHTLSYDFEHTTTENHIRNTLQKVDPQSGEISYYGLFPSTISLINKGVVDRYCVEPLKNVKGSDSQKLLISTFDKDGHVGVTAIPKPHKTLPDIFSKPSATVEKGPVKDNRSFEQAAAPLPFETDPKVIMQLLEKIKDYHSEKFSFDHLGIKTENNISYEVFVLTYSGDMRYIAGPEQGLNYEFKLPVTTKTYYYFDPKTYQLLKSKFTETYEGKEFEIEMSEYFYGFIKENAEKIFNPANYPFMRKVQLETGCYINHDTQEMTKMTDEEYKDFWKNLPAEQRASYNKQKTALNSK